jgi:hypothetical protein
MVFILFLPEQLDGPCEGLIIFLLGHGVQPYTEPIQQPAHINPYRPVISAIHDTFWVFAQCIYPDFLGTNAEIK